MKIKTHCAHDKFVKLRKITPHPDNENAHPDEQIRVLNSCIEWDGQNRHITKSFEGKSPL